MSCCPSARPASVIEAGLQPQPSEQIGATAGNNVDCLSRNTNAAPDEDKRTNSGETAAKNVIATSSIPVIYGANDSASIKTTFELVSGSDAPNVVWSAIGAPGGVTFSGNELRGTIASSDIGKAFKVTVTASSNGSAINSKEYNIAIAKKGGIKFQLADPLPGADRNITRGFSLAKVVHPVTGEAKKHFGIDMHMLNRSAGNVCAAADGEAYFVGTQKGYGNCIQLRHFDEQGKTLCYTFYGHLESFYVAKGAKVSAGQAIAKEGTTGESTGLHLHFELRLPDGLTKIDPIPYFKGLIYKDAKSTGTANAINGAAASITPDEMKARSGPCEAPSGGPELGPQLPPSTGDAFDLALHFTFKYEVGPLWDTSPAYGPTDPDIAAGRWATRRQRKKTGYVVWDKAHGGVTKFGICEKSGRSAATIQNLTFADAKAICYNQYWKDGTSKPYKYGKWVSILVFDMTYQHGAGGARGDMKLCNFNALPGAAENASREDQLAAVAVLTRQRIKSHPGSASIRAGVLKRYNACEQYIRSIK